MAALKVALVTASLSRRGGGVSAAVEALSRSLAGISGLDVRVFGIEDDAWNTEDARNWKGAPATVFRLIGPPALGYAPEMMRELVDWGPTIAHTNGIWMHPSRSVLQWSRRTGRPHVVSPHGMLDPWAVRNSRLRKQLAGALYEYAHLRSAAALHALCGPEEAAIRAFGLDQPVEIVPNGIDSPAIKTTPLAPWNDMLPVKSRVMLFLGRLHPKKNLLPFLRAWAAARNQKADNAGWYLIIAGWDQGGYVTCLRNEVEKLGLDSEILIMRPLFGDDKDAAFRNAAAFVLPSLSEGLPMTILEASSHGLPVLMTDACNLGEAFEVGAAKRLDLELSRMTEDLSGFLSLSAKELQVMGERGRTWMARDFTWKHIAERMTAVYRRILNSRLFSDPVYMP